MNKIHPNQTSIVHSQTKIFFPHFLEQILGTSALEVISNRSGDRLTSFFSCKLDKSKYHWSGFFFLGEDLALKNWPISRADRTIFTFSTTAVCKQQRWPICIFCSMNFMRQLNLSSRCKLKNELKYCQTKFRSSNCKKCALFYSKCHLYIVVCIRVCPKFQSFNK